MLSALLLLCGALQEPPGKTEWKLLYEDRFDLAWNFTEEDRTRRGAAPAPVQMVDKRTIEAELICFKAAPEWRLDIRWKKVAWLFQDGEFDVNLTKPEKGKAEFRLGIKARNTKDSPRRSIEVMELAKKKGEDMVTMIEGVYALAPLRTGECMFWRDGVAGRTANSVFDKAYAHSAWPAEGLKTGVQWKDYIKGMAPGEPDINTMDMKVTSADVKGATAKGSANKSLARELMPGRGMKSSWAIDREFFFSADGLLSSSSEETVYKRDVTATEAQYRENVIHTTKQTLKIVRQEKKKPAEPPK